VRGFVWLALGIADQLDIANGTSEELGALLLALHASALQPLRVEATFRVWRHRARTGRAFEVWSQDQQRQRGSATRRFGTGRRESRPDEESHTVRIWRDGEKIREEQRGGERDGYFAVMVPPLWWIWDERMGARSNEDDPSVGTQVGQEVEQMLDPTSLLSSLSFEPLGVGEVAGSASFSARARPRSRDDRFGGMGLGALGVGADYYELQVDQQRGKLLSATAFHDGEPFQKIEVLTIQFNPPPPEVFRFTPPEGEEIQSTWQGPTGLSDEVCLVCGENQGGLCCPAV
jgi:hypothetical protein